MVKHKRAETYIREIGSLYGRLFSPTEVNDMLKSPILLRDKLTRRIYVTDPTTGRRMALPYTSIRTAERYVNALDALIKADEIEGSLTYKLGRALTHINYGAAKILHILFGPAYATNPPANYLRKELP